MQNRLTFVGVPFVLANFLVTPDAGAEEKRFEDSKTCISVSFIRNTEILDDRNILFKMSGKRTYHVALARRCRGLKRQGGFSYNARGGRLCRLDSIRIIERGGFGIESGNSCQLGYFNPVEADEIEALIERSSASPEPKEVSLPEPEEVGGNGEDPENENEIQDKDE